MSGAVTQRLENIEVIYKDKKHTIPPLYKQDAGKLKICELNDLVIDFYTQWMFHERYSCEERRAYEVFSSFFYTHLSTRINQIKEPMRRSSLGESYSKLFRKPNTMIFSKKVLVLPIFLKKNRHWALALVHNPAGAILKEATPSEVNNNRRISDLKVKVDFELPDDECRILIMDSLITHVKFRPTLQRQHAQIVDTLRLWLQMEAAIDNKELLGSRVKSVTCEKLPAQPNAVDCGIFMLAFAEYFTHFNTEWMSYPTNVLEHLKIDEDVHSSLCSEEPRRRLEALLIDLAISSSPT